MNWYHSDIIPLHLNRKLFFASIMDPYPQKIHNHEHFHLVTKVPYPRPHPIFRPLARRNFEKRTIQRAQHQQLRAALAAVSRPRLLPLQLSPPRDVSIFTLRLRSRARASPVSEREALILAFTPVFVRRKRGERINEIEGIIIMRRSSSSSSLGTFPFFLEREKRGRMWMMEMKAYRVRGEFFMGAVCAGVAL